MRTARQPGTHERAMARTGSIVQNPRPDASVGQLGGERDRVHQGAVAQHGDLHPSPDRLLEQQTLQRLGVTERRPRNREDQVAGAEAAGRRRTARDDLDDAQGLALPSPAAQSGGRGAGEVTSPR